MALLVIFVLAFTAPLPVDLHGDIAAQVAALVHVVAYALLTAYTLCRYPSSAMAVMLAVLLFGTVLESVQFFVPGRFFGVDDLLANAFGVVIGALLVFRYIRRVAASHGSPPAPAVTVAPVI